MSDEVKDPSGVPAVDPSGISPEAKSESAIPSGDSVEETKKGKVEYETFHKTLAQKKNLQAKLEEVEKQMSQLQQDKLMAEGKKDELIQHLKEENESIKQKAEREAAEKAQMKINSQVQKTLVEMGCVDADLALGLVDVSRLDVDENFAVGADSLSLALDRIKKGKPYLFNNAKAKIVDGNPAGAEQVLNTNENSDYSSMDRESAKQAFQSQLSKLL